MAAAASSTISQRQKSPLTKLRSPSPPTRPVAESRGGSVVPQSPAAARFTSPQPETPFAKAVTPAPAATVPVAAPTALATPAPANTETGDSADEGVDEEGVIDIETFQQILDLDEDETHDFSLGMTEAYFSQASTTFTDMYNAFAKKDLATLSALGHFLKGSSAALGVSAVQASCEDIQHYGALRDEINNVELSPGDALAKIEPLLKRVKTDYAIAERWLKNWYKQNAVPAEV